MHIIAAKQDHSKLPQKSRQEAVHNNINSVRKWTKASQEILTST